MLKPSCQPLLALFALCLLTDLNAGEQKPPAAGNRELAVNVLLSFPHGAITVPDGTILFAETANHVVRGITVTGELFTFGGVFEEGFGGDGGAATEARLNQPYALAYDSSGNVYIADNYNNRVRRIDTTGRIATVAGTGAFGFSGDGGPATAATLAGPVSIAVDAGNNLYIADQYNHVIRKVDVNGIISTVAGRGGISGNNGDGTAVDALLSYPAAVAAGANGIYVADSFNNSIRKIHNGMLITVAGIGTDGFLGDGGLATVAQLNFPQGVWVDSSEQIFIADTYNHRIRKVDATGIIHTIAGTGTAGNSGDGGDPKLALLNYPTAVSTDSAGAVVITDTSNQRIRRIDTFGVIKTIAGGGSGGNQGGPARIISPLEVFTVAGDFFYYEVYASGDAPLTYSATNLPEGLTAQGGVISGTLKTKGDFQATITASNPQGADTETLVIHVVDSNEFVPDLTEILAFPNPAFTNEDVFFVLGAAVGEDGLLDVTWDFGDGTTGEGAFVFHAFTSVGTYTVSATAIDRDGLAVSKTINITVALGDPNAPQVVAVLPSKNPSVIDTDVSFEAAVFDPQGSAVTLQWNFGDGSPPVTGNTPTHRFTAEGEFNVTVTPTNASGLVGRAMQSTQFVFDTDGEDNPFEGEEAINPLKGLGMKLLDSECGVITLSIDVNALNRDAFDVTTNFGTGRSPVKGTRPSSKFTNAGLFVATAVATEKTTKAEKGRMRKTIPIGRREVGQPRNYDAEPADKKINVTSLKGVFEATRASASTSGEAKKKKDKVQIAGEIELPAGLDLTMPQEVQLACGNIIDRMIMEKGKAEGTITNLKISTKKQKNGKSVAGQKAKFKATLVSEGLIDSGFDTEGVSAESNGKTVKVQCAMYVAGSTYAFDMPVSVKVSKDETDISISGTRSGK